MSIRFYTPSDYSKLKILYESDGWFDPETDAEEKLIKQIEEDKESILLAMEGDKLLGTVTLLFTGRLGLFFRLVATSNEIRIALITEGEKIFKEHGYNEVHIIIPEEDTLRQLEYEEYGFKKGRPYRWFWKKATT